MNESLATGRSTVKSELGLLIGILCGLAVIVGFFYWWGSGDRLFYQRKSEILLDQLTRVTNARQGQTGMALFVSYSKEADTTGRLLEGQLDPETWLQVAQQRATAICTLVAMGDQNRSGDLVELCAKLNQNADPRAREIGSAAQCSLDFERQYVLCMHRMIVEEIVEAASAEDCGDVGKQIVNRIRQQQQTDWRLATVARELLDLGKSLPAGNQLSPNLPRYVSQLIDIEETFEKRATVPTYADWIQQVEGLVAQYPENEMICRTLADNYDRLNRLRCYVEAEQLLDSALNKYRDQGISEPGSFVSELVDRESASQVQLNRWKALVQSNPEDSISLADTMIQSARELQANRRISKGIVERYIDVVEEMERSQQYEAISKIRDELTAILANNKEGSERFQSYCAASSKRSALVGKPFVLPSGLASQTPLDPQVFRDHVTAVVFWGADAASLDVLAQLEHLYIQHKGAGFGLIAINVDKDLELVRTMIAEQEPEWTVIVASGPDATGNNPLAVEYGIHQTPYLILVDSAGLVVDVALSVHDLWDRATALRPSLKTVAVPRQRGPAGR